MMLRVLGHPPTHTDRHFVVNGMAPSIFPAVLESWHGRQQVHIYILEREMTYSSRMSKDATMDSMVFIHTL